MKSIAWIEIISELSYLFVEWDVKTLLTITLLQAIDRTSVALKRKRLTSVFTALHGMQTRSCDENSVRLSVSQTRGL